MNLLQDLSNISQVIAALAVVASVVYLAVQTRQATRSQRAAMHLARAREMSEHGLRMSQPDMSAIFAKVRRGDELNDFEFTQLISLMMPVFDGVEEQYRQHREGLIDASRWHSTLENLKLFLGAPEVRAMWRVLRIRFDKAFATVIDDLVKKARHVPEARMIDSWHQIIAEERKLHPQDFVTAKHTA